MQANHTFKLIDGHFQPNEAARILLQLINDKINYHSVEMLSLKERFNGDTSHSVKRIDDLSEVRERLREVLISAEHEGYSLVIEGLIRISLVKE